MPLENASQIQKQIPDGVWTKCEDCEQIIYNKALEENLKVCPKCGAHFRLNARERIAQLFDPKSFKELGEAISPMDPLEFSDLQPYEKRLSDAQKKTGNKDACIAGEGTIEGRPLAAAVLDFEFMGGSMGSVVGEKITLAIERAIKKSLPMLIVLLLVVHACRSPSSR